MKALIGVVDVIIVCFSILVVVLALGLYNKVNAKNTILCKKIYTTELKADSEIKQICDDTTISLGEADKISSK